MSDSLSFSSNVLGSRDVYEGQRLLLQLLEVVPYPLIPLEIGGGDLCRFDLLHKLLVIQVTDGQIPHGRCDIPVPKHPLNVLWAELGGVARRECGAELMAIRPPGYPGSLCQSFHDPQQMVIRTTDS